MAKVFRVGDTVFAKVRGYPAWPARVDKIEKGRSNKSKYHVIFYGTFETAVCQAGAVYQFEEYKEQYGKRIKRKGFIEALSQVEGLLRERAVKNQGVETRNQRKDRDAEGQLVVGENPRNGAKQANRKKKVTKRGNRSDDKSVNGSNSVTKYSPPQKRLRRGSIPQKDTNIATPSSSDNKLMNSSKPKMVRRSGRNIKPRNFADEDRNRSTSYSDGEIGLTANGSSKKQPFRRQSDATNINAKRQIQLSVRTPSALNNSIPPPTTVHSDDEFGTLSNMEIMRRIKLAWFRTEASMLETETNIRKYLSPSKANTAESVILLAHLSNLYIRPLMLKKHPFVVFTIKKLRRYVGNPGAWNLTEAQERTFQSEALQIRNQSDFLYNKFKEMFNVPENREFIDVFTEQVETFKRLTESLSEECICALTNESSLQKYSLEAQQELEANRLQSSNPTPELEANRVQSPNHTSELEANRVQIPNYTQEPQLCTLMCTRPFVTIKVEPLDMDQVSDDGPCCCSHLPEVGETTEIGKVEPKIEEELTLSPVKLESDLTSPMEEEEEEQIAAD